LNRQAELEHEGRVLSLTLAPITDSGYVNIYGLDVTENRRLQQEVLRINDTVQGKIGRDLHDGLLQQLTGLTYFSDTLAENLAEVASPCVDGAHEISEHLRRLTSWIRDLAKGLYPTDLDNIGLAPALERLASTTAHLFSTSVVFECNEPVTISNHQVALHLYRIAQEAVNNAVKHGDAKHIHIGLNRSGDAIVLTVKDDGSGFSPEKAAAGVGLQSIHFRGRAIGAVVDVKSDVGQGTIVSCSFQELDKS
jgi:two-component system CheB/CheR fusion protein